MKYKQWIGEIRSWITKEPDAFYGVIVLMESSCICFWLAPTELWVVLWGVFLQVLGVMVAIQNLLSIRIACNQIPLKDRFCVWIKAFPRLNNPPKHIELILNTGVVVGSTVSAQAHLTIENESLEAKVERLQQQMDMIQENSDIQKVKIEGLEDNLSKLQATEEVARKTLRTEIRKEIEHLFTQDIIGSLVGLILVIYGVVLSTLAEAIFNL